MPKGVYERTEEIKKSMSESRKGKRMGANNSFYGKHHTEETKKRLSKLAKGRTPWNKGIPMCEEQKRKLSEAKKGQIPWNKGKKGAQKAWNKGLTKETNEGIRKGGEKVSKARLKRKQELGYLQSPEARKKQGESLKNLWKTNDYRNKILESRLGYKHSDDTKKKQSEKAKETWKDQKIRKKREISMKENHADFRKEKHPQWNPNREEIYAPYGENFYEQQLRNEKWNLQNGRDMLTGTKLNPNKRSAYHHIDYCKSNDDPNNHCFLSINNHGRITCYQSNPMKSERYKKILQANTLALKNGQIPKKWSPLNKELYRQEKLKQLDLSSYII